MIDTVAFMERSGRRTDARGFGERAWIEERRPAFLPVDRWAMKPCGCADCLRLRTGNDADAIARYMEGRANV